MSDLVLGVLTALRGWKALTPNVRGENLWGEMTWRSKYTV
jgi:hypothetical protein